MESLNVSEVQFAFNFYAKFNELNNYSFNRIIAPSTVLEGKAGYDYSGLDLVLGQYFIQFKTTEVALTKKDGNKKDVLDAPYFKFPLRNKPTKSGKSQLDFLIDHAQDKSKMVRYVVPSFDTSKYGPESGKTNFWFEEFYKSDPKNIYDFCTLIDIGSIKREWVNNFSKHRICFNHKSGKATLFSKPKKIDTSKDDLRQFDFNEFLKERIGNLNNRAASVETLELRDIILKLDKEVSALFDLETISKNSKNPLYDIQQKTLAYLDVFWIPIIIKRGDFREYKIDQIFKD